MTNEDRMKIHEQGLAYKHITDTMGPSPQLVAFVNYDKAMDENCGLESMNIMSQHEAILSEIESLDDAGYMQDDSHDETDLEMLSLVTLGDEIDQLESMHDTIKDHGLNASSYGILKSTNLLCGTSFDAIAVENLAGGGNDENQTQLALEGIVDTMKQKAAAWSARVIQQIKRIKNISFDSIKNKISATLTKLKTKTIDLGKTIKAHPYKSALAILGSIVSVAGILTYVGQKLQSSTNANNDEIKKIWDEAFIKYAEATGQRSDFKFTKNDFERQGHLDVFNANIEASKSSGLLTAPDAGTWKELGWTQQNIVDFSNKVMRSFQTVQSALGVFVAGATKFSLGGKEAFTAAVATEKLQIPGVSKKSSHRIITSLFWAVYRLVKKYIGGGYHFIASILLRLTGH